MAAVDSFHLLYRQVSQSCHSHVEFFAVVGTLYTTHKALRILCGCYSLFRLHVTPHLLGRTSLVKKYGEWAVVTGATDIISKAYAEVLASRGVNIILISCSREKLQEISESIASTYGVRTSSLEVDFNRGREVYPIIKKALSDINVGILVNNAEMFSDYPQCFMETPEDKLWELINSNIAAATMMVHIVLPGMVERKKGAIVNVSSRSCCKRIPRLALYSASKGYLDSLSQDLAHELSPKGIFVQSLMPLCVGPKERRCCGLLHHIPFLVPSPDVYAHHAVRMLGITTRTTGYWGHSLQVIISRWIPGWIFGSISQLVSASTRHSADT